PRRPDALRGRKGLGKHPRRPSLRRARANRAARRRHRPLGAVETALRRINSRVLMARISLPDRFRRRPSEGAGESGPPTPPRAPRLPPAGTLRRERRALVRTREDRIRDLGGLMLQTYRRDQFKQALLVAQCPEVI